MARYQPLEPARIDWRGHTPHSGRYGDIYFSRDDAVAETRHVFLQGNELPRRWRERDRFCIGETGFGTGLNLLCTLEAWLADAPATARLEYISVEKHPLSRADLARALAAWPQFTPLADALLAHYPPLVHGLHRRELLDGRVGLTLLFGDAEVMLADLEGRHIDAWYLDGFAPRRNPDMWTEGLFRHIARLSRAGASCATFTAAGAVRRGLQQAGFEMATRPGFGRKRDMLSGQLITSPDAPSPQPWFRYPDIKVSQRRAVIIGAGLAGCTTAHALAERGWRITLIERHAQPAQEASGNLAGVVMPRLTADMSAAGRFYLSAFLHTSHWLNQLKQRDPDLPWFQSGVLQLCDERQCQRMQALGLPSEVLEICDRENASERCGVATKQGGLFFPGGGWLEPPALCRWLLQDQADHIECILNQSALSLERADGQWRIHGEHGEIAGAETLIIANGYDAERLLGTDIFRLQKVRGQIAYLPATETSRNLKTPVCYDGYVIPAHQGLHCTGATYDLNDASPTVNEESQQQLLTNLRKALPVFKGTAVDGGRVAFRTSTQDHLPLIGPVPDERVYHDHYAELHHGRPARRYRPADYWPDLFLNVGHGSRGLSSCPLASAIIAHTLDQSVPAAGMDIINATHPARFLIRRLKHTPSQA